MDLKIFEAIDTIETEEHLEEHDEEDDEYTPQVFPEHESQTAEYRKTLYYGSMPATDRPSMPLTRLAVEKFTSTGLDALGQKLGRLDMARAADISKQACAGPNSLVLALLYLDRLRRRNPEYLTTVSSADLFLVSLMVASKFLHDDGEEDEVFNDEWANSGGMDTKELNRLELKFLAALDWRIHVDVSEFHKTLQAVEADIAIREVISRDYASYSDLVVLTSGEHARQLLTFITTAAIKVTAVCLTTYAAGLLTLLGTAAALSRTPLGPAAVSDSVRTLVKACSGMEEQDLVSEEARDELRSSNLTTADLVTASLLVTTLTSAPLTGEDGKHLDDELGEEGRNLLREEEIRQEMNRSRAMWLSDYSQDRGLGHHITAPDLAAYSLEPIVHSKPIYTDILLSPALLSKKIWPEQDWGPKVVSSCPVLRWGQTLSSAWPALLVTG